MNFEDLYAALLTWGIATEEELQLVCGISGARLETLEDVLYYRTGYRTWEDYYSDDYED